MQKLLIVVTLLLAATVGFTGAFGTWAADYALADSGCHLVAGTCDPLYVSRFTGCAVAMVMAFGLLLMTADKLRRMQ